MSVSVHITFANEGERALVMEQIASIEGVELVPLNSHQPGGDPAFYNGATSFKVVISDYEEGE